MLTLITIGLVAGAVTAVSPCVLPVLPVIFFGAGTDTASAHTSEPNNTVSNNTLANSTNSNSTVLTRRRTNRTRPALIVAGLVLSFAVVTLTGSLLLAALNLPGDVLRWAGLVVLFLVGLGLVVPSVQRLVQRPFSRLPQADASSAGGPFVLGLALGTLYVPCAGPVIAAMAIAGATGRVDGGILVLTVAFAVGTAIPLLLFAYAGDWIGRRLSGLKSGARRFRIAGGVVMMALAVALTFNLTDGLARAVPSYTAAIQESVEGSDDAREALNALTPNSPPSAESESTASGEESGNEVPLAAAQPDPAGPAVGPVAECRSAADTFANCGPAPALVGIETWINTTDGAPVDLESLRGRVVLVDFWTFACINCQRVLPYVTSWYDTYRDSGLTVIGVHTPEFSFERDADNVRQAVAAEGIKYPVGLDNSSSTWVNYGNSYWPAAYLIDATGTIRYVKFGEGDYAHTETLIRQLLVAANPGTVLPPPTDPTVS